MGKKIKPDLQVIIASGPKDLGRAVLGFAFASSAAVSNIRVKITLALDGIAWAAKNEPAAKKSIHGFSPISQYLGILAKSGADINACSTCIKNACKIKRGAKSRFNNLTAAGMSELALATCSGRAYTVVF
jgi:predicted peroxiredoxin